MRFSLPIIQIISLPNDADVFILTSRYNLRRKAPVTPLKHSDDAESWHEKTLTAVRDESQSITDEDVDFIKNVFGDRLKMFYFVDDLPQYQRQLQEKRLEMMRVVNDYRKNNTPAPFGSNVEGPLNNNVRCVVDQYGHVKRCYEFMEEFELLNGFKYDYVVRARLDFIAPFKFDISHYYLGHDHHYLYACGSFRRDPMEWADEFCWFSNRQVAQKLFPSLSEMGLIVDKRGKNTIHNDNEFLFSAETQFSLLLHKLNLPVINAKIYRSSRYTDGGDGYDYLNYMFQRFKLKIEDEYEVVCKSPSDINEHLPTLREYASECKHVTELGTRYGNSTIAFMAAGLEKLISYDVAYNTKLDYLKLIAEDNNVNFTLKLENPQSIEETDLLFIDTDHHVDQCSKELALHADKVKRYIIFHDTSSFWEKGQGYESGGGLRYAIEPFLENHKEWKVVYKVDNNNGLMVLQRI